MSIEWLAELGWKSFVLATLTLALLALARRRSAAEKSLIGDSGLLSLLVLPLTMGWLPQLELAAPEAVAATIERLAPASDPGAETLGVTGAAQAAGAFDWNLPAVAIYLVGAAALAAGLLWALARMRGLYGRARVLEDGRWLSALAAAQNRIGVKHGTALLISDEVNSPVSWGVVRPVIVIDPSARQSFGRAEAIIAHELAHVHRLDWLRLILARIAVAILWFNPLVWVLARRSHQLREEAADDEVLRSRIARSDYAELLVTAARHANRQPLLVANGVAPSKSSIAQRVSHVLDGSKPRTPAPLKWAAATLVVALGANAALAAAEPVLERSWGIDPGAGERAAAQLAEIPGAQVQALAAAIRSGDWSARKAGGPTMFDEPKARQPLMLALRDDDATVRRIAVWGLSEMRPGPDPMATPAVSRLLNDPSPLVRAEAAGAIGEFNSVRNSRSVEKLLLGDPVPAVRLRAAHALGDIRDPESRPALERALSDPDPAVRRKAAWALGQVAELEELVKR